MFSQSLFAQGTAFTYQGRLIDGGGPANGTYDLQFTIYDALSGGSVIAGPLTNAATAINNGLFTVALDFGAGPFSAGSPRWLEIQVRTNGNGSFGVLNPRQPLTATPYAITAGTLTGTVGPSALSGSYGNAISFTNPTNQFTGTFNGNGLGLTNVNAVTLGGLGAANFWQLGGNAPGPGQFLGTTNSQPLEFRANNLRALLLAPTTNTVNFIGGDSNNFVAPGVYGATIGGGGTLAYPGGTGLTNSVQANFATIGGGVGNTAGGSLNRPDGDSGTVAGGWQNSALGNNATVAGGAQNTSSGDNSTVGGGAVNMSSGNNSTVAGGIGNTNSGYSSATGGGYYNTNSGYIATIAGGGNNISSGVQSTVGGGALNTSSGFDSTVAGGSENLATAQGSTVAGGIQNISSNFNATVPGGQGNIAGGIGSFAAGSVAQALHDGAFVWADATGTPFASTANNQFLIRAGGGVGIGTASPNGRLQVNGPVVFQGGFTPASTTASNLLNLAVGLNANGLQNGISFYETAGNAAMTLGYDGTVPGTVNNALRIYDAVGIPKVTFQFGGNVGVGTTAPLAQLHVAQGNTGIGANPNSMVVFEKTNTAYLSIVAPLTNETGILFGDSTNSTDGGIVFNNGATARGLQFRTAGNNTRMVILDNGNIGIGKTNPASALDVQGSITAAGFQGNGNALSNVNATTFGGLGPSNYWGLAGNNVAAGQFIGSTNFQALELWANRRRALRLEPTVDFAGGSNIVNVIGGSSVNAALNGAYGATIAGGGALNYGGGGFASNIVTGDFGTVGGGLANQSESFGTVAGGVNNIASVGNSTVGGGAGNSATNQSTIAGGANNTAMGQGSTVGGGNVNLCNGLYPTIAGGQQNFATNHYAVVVGGLQNVSSGQGSTISGGVFNNAVHNFEVIGGGSNNIAQNDASTIGGGRINTAVGVYSTVAGGFTNLAFGYAGTVGGGAANTAFGSYSTVAGGSNNTALADFSAAAGRRARANHTGTFVWADSTDADFTSSAANQFLIRAGGGVGIGTTAPEAPLHVEEGSAGTVTANPNSIAAFERSGSAYISVLGPTASEVGILFGNPNTNTDGGIIFNNPSVPHGLEFRTASNAVQMVILANGNVGIGTTAPTHPLEVQNNGDTEIGLKSTDAGGRLWTIQSSAVTGSSRDASFQIIDRSTNASRLLIDTNGFVGIGTASPTNRLHVNGGITCTALVQTSDRNAKENFALVSPSEVLSKVVALPITTWNFKTFNDGRHMGPMAQDFYAAFGLGGNETTITAVDPQGVALAAIQGLNEKLEQKETEITELKQELRELKKCVDQLKETNEPGAR